ncbi:MAG: hypothetical protein ABL931_05305 [Usitatibacteraceae bacterium]
MTAPTFPSYFAVQPVPSDLVEQQIVFDSIGIVVLGVIAAWLNKQTQLYPSCAAGRVVSPAQAGVQFCVRRVAAELGPRPSPGRQFLGLRGESAA